MKNMLQVGCDKKNIYLLVQENIIKLGGLSHWVRLFLITNYIIWQLIHLIYKLCQKIN